MNLLQLNKVPDPVLLGDLDDVLLQLALKRGLLALWQKYYPIEYLEGLMGHHWWFTDQNMWVFPWFALLLVLRRDLPVLWGLQRLATWKVLDYLCLFMGKVVYRGWLLGMILSGGDHFLDIHLFGHFDPVHTFLYRIVSTVYSPKRRLIIRQLALQTVHLFNALFRHVIIFFWDGIDGKNWIGHGLVGLVLDCGLLGAHLLDALEVDFLEVGASHSTDRMTKFRNN